MPSNIQTNILKIFESSLAENIEPLLDEMIPENQYGFRKHSSVNNQLIDVLHYIINAFNDNKVLCVDIIFLTIVMLTKK